MFGQKMLGLLRRWNRQGSQTKYRSPNRLKMLYRLISDIDQVKKFPTERIKWFRLFFLTQVLLLSLPCYHWLQTKTIVNTEESNVPSNLPWWTSAASESELISVSDDMEPFVNVNPGSVFFPFSSYFFVTLLEPNYILENQILRP